MYFTDRGIEELEKRRGDEEVTLAWIAERLQEFNDIQPELQTPVEPVSACAGGRSPPPPRSSRRRSSGLPRGWRGSTTPWTNRPMASAPSVYPAAPWRLQG